MGPFGKQQVTHYSLAGKVLWGNRVYTMNGLESVLNLVISEEWQSQNYV